MNPTEQQLAIARACNWRRAPEYDIGGLEFYQDGHRLLARTSLPDYLHDLNAMHDALFQLAGDGDKQRTFVRHLLKLDDQFTRQEQYPDWEAFMEHRLNQIGWDEAFIFILRAPAAELAEAFLKTLNLWSET